MTRRLPPILIPVLLLQACSGSDPQSDGAGLGEGSGGAAATASSGGAAPIDGAGGLTGAATGGLAAGAGGLSAGAGGALGTGTGGVPSGDGGGPSVQPVDCSGIADAGFELCATSTDSCSAVFTGSEGCGAVCAAAGLSCQGAYENVDDACTADMDLPSVACESGHISDFCVCGPSDLGTGGAPSSGGAPSTGGAPSAGGDTGSGGTPSDPIVLPQANNPVLSWFEGARTEWSMGLADTVLSYQQSNGGWPKNVDYESEGAGNGGNDLGTFDNGATVTEVVYLAEVYRQGNVTKYRDAIRAVFDFILDAQYPSGGWPQFYPLKGGYADHVTYNDNAMAYVLTVLHQAVQQAPPFDTDLFTDGDRNAFRSAIEGGVDYILNSQWRQGGTLTVWCAQHGKDDYLPKAARAYELESLSGSESVGIIAFLMTQPQTTEIETAVKAALAWYRSPNTYLADYTYDTNQDPPIVAAPGSRMWYRFYKLDNNAGFFSDRDGGTYYDIMQISEERRTGYRWGGNWGERIISYASSVGY